MATHAHRFGWMDLLRGVAAVLVVMLHATLMVEQLQLTPDPTLVAINKLFAGYRMPLLMVLSGMLLPHALAKPLVTYAIGKISGVLYPYLIWSALYAALLRPELLMRSALWIGGSYLWFLIFLFTYFVAALLLRRVPAAAIFAAAGIASYLSPDDSKYFERYFFLMAMFFLGKFLAEQPRLLQRLTTGRAAIVTGIATAAMAIGTFLQEGLKFKIEAVPLIAGSTLFLFWLAHRLETRDAARPLAFAGRNSLVFYVTHYPVCYATTWACVGAGLRDPLPIFAINLVTALALCTLIAIAQERRTALQWPYRIPDRARQRLAGLIDRHRPALR